jgi:hypothetical protein
MWIDKTIEWMQKIYSMIPLRLRWIINPFAFVIAYPLRFRLELWIARGTMQNSEMPLSILCAAQSKQNKFIANFLELIFGESFEEIYHEHTWLWNISDILQKKGPECSMMFMNVSKFHRNWLSIRNCFNVGWVIGEISIPIDKTVMEKRSIKSDLSKIKKYSLDFEVTRDPQCFFDFYLKMYVPHIFKVFGKTAVIVPYSPTFHENRDLLLIKKEEKGIAGVTICYDKNGPRLEKNGILDGNTKYLREGALSASYFFAFHYLEQKGFRKVGLGRSSPFFHDGVLKYKAKWSQEIIQSDADFVLKILSNTVATRTFLRNNPFIFKKEGKLYGALFKDNEKPFSLEELKQIDKDYFLPGLSKLFIYSFHLDDAMNEQLIPSELSDHIVYCSAKYMFD